jgi:hypothetical protein
MGRVPNYAEPGSLLKGAPEKGHPQHLANIRTLPCVNCGREPCGTAAHLRMRSYKDSKNNPGFASKPSDKWVTPLCHKCHMSQHGRGERVWWRQVCGIRALQLARDLWASKDNVGRMREIAILALISKKPKRLVHYWKLSDPHAKP